MGLAGGGGVVVGGADDLEAGGGGGLLVDQDDGAGGGSGVADLAAGEFGRGKGGSGSGGVGDDGVGAGGGVDVSRVAAEADVVGDGSDAAEGTARRQQVEIDGAGPGGLVEEAEGSLAGWRGEGLILEQRHLEVGGDVSGEQGVLAAGREVSADGGELLLGCRGEGCVSVGSGCDGDVGADGAEAD